MLTVTPAAAEAVDTLLANSEAPTGAGLRLERAVDSAGEAAIGLQIVTEAGPDDELVPAAMEYDVFVSPDIADVLDNHVLDAEVSDQSVAFTLHPQSPNGPPLTE